MPPAVAAAGITVGGSLLGSLLNRPSSADRALQQAQTSSLNSQTQLADLLQKIGKDQLALTGPAYRQAQSYYQTLLNGDRGAMLQAMNPERSQIADLYRGSDARIARTTTGAVRDQALAENARSQAEKLANLVPNARAGAASTLYAGADPAHILGFLTSAGSGYNSAANMASTAFQDDTARRTASANSGAAFAKLLSNIDWSALFGKKSGGTNPAAYFNGSLFRPR